MSKVSFPFRLKTWDLIQPNRSFSLDCQPSLPYVTHKDAILPHHHDYSVQPTHYEWIMLRKRKPTHFAKYWSFWLFPDLEIFLYICFSLVSFTCNDVARRIDLYVKTIPLFFFSLFVVKTATNIFSYKQKYETAGKRLNLSLKQKFSTVRADDLSSCELYNTGSSDCS